MTQQPLTQRSNEYLTPDTASFAELLSSMAPQMWPPASIDSSAPEMRRHGTFIVAVKYTQGVVIAAHRRSALGHVITQQDIGQVISSTASHAVTAMAGPSGLVFETMRLFTIEVEHFEKVDGHRLSLDGQAARLSNLVRVTNTPTSGGILVTPILAGWDEDRHRARIFSYDVTGGRIEEASFACAGKGMIFAKNHLSSANLAAMSQAQAIHMTLQAVHAATADDPVPSLADAVVPEVRIIDPSGITTPDTTQVRRWLKDLVDAHTIGADTAAATPRTHPTDDTSNPTDATSDAATSEDPAELEHTTDDASSLASGEDSGGEHQEGASGQTHSPHEDGLDQNTSRKSRTTSEKMRESEELHGSEKLHGEDR